MIKKTITAIGVVLVLCIVAMLAKFGIGFGNGNGSGKGDGVSQTEMVGSKDAVSLDEDEMPVVVVRVEDTSIWVGETACSSAEEIKSLIAKIHAENDKTIYRFEHEFAIKSTYDEVSEVLNGLEEALGIIVED